MFKLFFDFLLKSFFVIVELSISSQSMESVPVVTLETPAQPLYTPIECLYPLFVVNVQFGFAGFSKILENKLEFSSSNIVKLGF